ncbi:MAG TPA: ATP-dependent zinc metalloprotease FtsH [Candidatus Binataceae bacterium]|nr:ATP-dependent zinc metalloprotease FtsH [Candidatus Binataceae bacterium]
MQDTEPQRKKPEPKPQISRSLWFWWFASSVLLVWSLFNLWTGPPSGVVDIPYSTFLEQVRADNVSKIHIAADAITGTFVKPLLWPKPGQKIEAKSPASPMSSEKSASEKSASGLASSPKANSERTNLPAPTHYREFRTTFPAVIGDPNLIGLLESHHITVEVSAASRPWLIDLLINWFPMLLLIGFFWWMATSASRGQSGMFGFGRMKARRYSSDQPKVTFSDVAGADEAKTELREEVDFLRNPQKYRDLGASIPRGVLLVGPPGTGKTLLARAVAGEAGVPFFSINASEFVEMFVGVGASRVRDLFRQAKEAAPAIVFVDELDAVGRRRGAGVGSGSDEREQTLNQLLGELDGFDPRLDVIILAATNRPDVLDPALLRPGRFDRQVVIELPDRKGREDILRIHARRLRLAGDVDFPLLAKMSIGLNGADLANLCNEAALVAARHNRGVVAMTDFEEAHDRVRLGVAHPQLTDPKERRVIAYHEAGHAVVAWFTPAADPVQKVTIVPHGQALGVTEQIPGEERHNFSQTYLKARLAVMLGGRTAEEIAIGEITTGAENDLVEATRLARRMVTRWGMAKLGPIAFRADEQQPFLGYELSQRPDYSEATAAEIDDEVRRLLEEAHQEVRSQLTTVREHLDNLADALLREETVELDELNRILGPRDRAESQKVEPRARASSRS